MKGKPWTDDETKAVLKAIAKARSGDEAVELAREAAPALAATINRGSLDIKLARLGRPTVTAIVSANLAKDFARDPKKAAREHVAKEAVSRNELEAHRANLKITELETRLEKTVRELHDAHGQINALRDLRAIKPAKPVIAPRGRGEGKQRLGVPVALFSDWHVEEPVDPNTVNGLNKYDLDIADACIKKLAEDFAWMLRDPRYDCRTAVVWYGGDLFSGYIHDELIEGNFLSPTRAMAWLLPRMEAQIRKILAECPSIERLIVVCNDGNHGRNTHKIRIATRTANSLEWLLYFELANRFRGEPRVEFQIAEGEYSYLTVYDQTLCFFHGDSVKYQGGVGGLLVPMKRGLNELRKYRPVHVFHAGHFHQYTNHQDIVVNGSMIGLNAYAMRYKFAPEPRQQAWYMLDATRGKCLSAPLWLPQYQP